MKMNEIFVAPYGCDTAKGTADAPFASFARAKEEVRRLRKEMDSDITVTFREGIYFFDDTETLSTEDSGENGYNVIYRSYPGEVARFSGGVKIEGWKLHDPDKNIWVADAKGVFSRQFFINGQRRWRAKAKGDKLIQFYGIADGDTMSAIITANGAAPYFAGYKNLTDIEIVWQLSFQDHHFCVQGVKGNMVMMPEMFSKGKCNPYRGQSPNHRNVLRIENAYEFLDFPGEWYLDRTDDKIYYIPKGNENLAEAETIIPKLERLLKVEGEPQNRAHNIKFEGIHFEHTTWFGPNSSEFGYPAFQAGFTREFYEGYPDRDIFWMTTCVEVKYSDYISFHRCKVQHVGSAGLWFTRGCGYSEVAGCEFTDISSNALVVGYNVVEWARGDDELHHIKLHDNYVHDIGYEFMGSVGIGVLFAQYTEVANNTLHDMPYTAISIGWGWFNHWNKGSWYLDEEDGYRKNPTPSWKNKVLRNHIYDVMTKIDDGACIYALGPNPHLEVSENFFHDSVVGRHILSCGLYFDNGVRFINAHRNVSYEVPVTLYVKGGDNVITDNYFDKWYISHRVSFDQRLGCYEGGMDKEGKCKQNIIDNHVILDGNFPKDIMENAGITAAYKDILGE